MVTKNIDIFTEKPVLISDRNLVKAYRSEYIPIAIGLVLAIALGCIAIINLYLGVQDYQFITFLILSILPLVFFMLYYLTLATARQMKVYEKGLTIPFRSINKIIRKADHYVDLDNIREITIWVDDDGTVEVALRVKNRMIPSLPGKKLLGFEFIIKFIDFAKANEKWLDKLKVDADVWKILEIRNRSLLSSAGK